MHNNGGTSKWTELNLLELDLISSEGDYEYEYVSDVGKYRRIYRNGTDNAGKPWS